MIRKFKFSFDDLYHRCVLLVKLLSRDLTQFVKFGFPETIADKIKALLLEFDQVEMDIVMLDNQKQASVDKKDIVSSIKALLEEMQMISDVAFRNGTAPYRLINLGGVSTYSMKELKTVASSYVRLLTKRIDMLDDFGLNPSQVTALEAEVKAFNEANGEQNLAKLERKIMTDQRVVVANNLYEEYIKLSGIGKDIWSIENPAKAENYLIYRSQAVAEEPDEGGGERTSTDDEVELSNG